MIEALRQLGATVTEVPGDGAFGPDLEITPISLDAPAADTADRLRPGRHGHALRAAGGRAAPRRVPLRRRPARPQAPDGHHHRGPGRPRRGGQRARRRPGVVPAVHRGRHRRGPRRPPRHRRQRLIPVRLRPAAGRCPLHRGAPSRARRKACAEPGPHQHDRGRAARRRRRRSTTPCRTTGLSPRARSAPSTSGSSRTSPTPAPSWPRPSPPAEPCGSRTGRRETTQVGDLWRGILAAMGATRRA